MTLIQNGFTVLVLTVVSQASQLCFKEFSTEPSRILGRFFLCEGQCCNPRSTKTCCEVERFPKVAIAGSVIGAMFVILVIAGVVYFCRKSRRKAPRNQPPMFTALGEPVVLPPPEPARPTPPPSRLALGTPVARPPFEPARPTPPDENTPPPTYDECVTKTPPGVYTVSPQSCSSVVDDPPDRGF
ncbi:actin nucleation-promoting factor WASL-like isoform X2 [Haliotis cracherodii]|uniref:actin nucleation-promoting factor WASL-like isoform X2 n=1 Tax=Haliotis cracherodii TaxID=6455 RepID=UPI0039ECCBCA